VFFVETKSTNELSMIELAYELLVGKKKSAQFEELASEIHKMKHVNEKELAEKLSQFYTDLNIDGRFIFMGKEGWGLRGWYPFEQIDEEVVMPTKPKKKRSKKNKDDDFDNTFEDEGDDGFDEEFLEEDILEEDDEILDDEDDFDGEEE
jgi:DNA-directed RNA polymerase subunit delta